MEKENPENMEMDAVNDNAQTENVHQPDFCVEIEDDESMLLSSGAAKVQNQNNRLLEVYKKTQQNLQAGANVLMDLRKQREQLNRASVALEETHGGLDQSNRIMTKIFRRIAVNKALYWGILSLLIVSIILVIYRKLF